MRWSRKSPDVMKEVEDKVRVIVGVAQDPDAMGDADSAAEDDE